MISFSPLVYELTQGTWFSLSLILFCMFGYIAYKAWCELGYHAAETKASIALATLFLASTLSRSWLWLDLWVTNRGYGDLVSVNVFWPIIANVLGIIGGLCAVRVFYPMWLHKMDNAAIWIIPLFLILVFLVVSQFI